MKNFKNRVAAITGAGSGIGQALAQHLGRQGCHLALSDINEAGLRETEKRVRHQDIRVTTHRVDVADRKAVYAWADDVAEAHQSVHMIFNNAGVALASKVEGVSYQDFEWLMNINFWGVVYGTKAFLPHLKRADEGHVINLSSLFGLISVPTQSVYNSAKFAVRGFSDALGEELDMEQSSVRVSCVYPGGVKTNIAAAARMADNVMGTYIQEKQGAADHFLDVAKTTSERAAAIILAGVQRDARRILVGRDAKLADAIQRLFPVLYQKLLVRGARKRMMPERP